MTTTDHPPDNGLTAEQIAQVRQTVATWAPMSDDQRDGIAALFQCDSRPLSSTLSD
jgi:hypothetical protein